MALIVLTLVAAAALYLDSASDPGITALVEAMESRNREPEALVAEAGRSARLVLLSDIHGRAMPKRIAARAIRALAEGPGLDAVVLGVPSDEQEYIDAYLNAAADDANALLSRPAAVRESEGLAREYLEIYRAVRAVNDEVGAARRIRVIAGDLPGWPPPDGASPEEIAELFVPRAEHMLQRLDQELLSIMPDARVLFFVDGYLTLKRTYGEIRFAGGRSVRTEWLGELLRRRGAADTRTILLDAAADAGSLARIPRYRGTGLHRPLRRELDAVRAVPVSDAFAVVPDPVTELSAPGIALEILPNRYVLRDVADGYIFLPGGR